MLACVSALGSTEGEWSHHAHPPPPPPPPPPPVCSRVWVRGKGGVIVGDLPPYEAFPIGGTNSVRGYSEGAAAAVREAVCLAWLAGAAPGTELWLLAARSALAAALIPNLSLRPLHARALPPHASAGGVGSGRNFVAGSAEVRIPLKSPVEATLFGDYGSDLDSGASVLGDPAGARGKPGAPACLTLTALAVVLLGTQLLDARGWAWVHAWCLVDASRDALQSQPCPPPTPALPSAPPPALFRLPLQAAAMRWAPGCG